MIRRVQALSGFTGRKGLRRRFIKSKFKYFSLTGNRVLKLIDLSIRGVARTCSGAVKCVEIARNTNGVGRQLVDY